MLEKLKKLNPEIKLHSIHSDEFKKYGRVIAADTREITEACSKLTLPEEGSAYEATVKELEELQCSDKLREMNFGGCNAQIGICHGHNTQMNGMEFHHSSEINVAATPLVLILGHVYDMDGSEYMSEKAEAFYLEKGDIVEIYGTSLHFCPCQVTDDGFSSVVVLPEGTNTALDRPSDDKLLFKKNKWIICHEKNASLIERGVYPGIHGVNYEIRY